MYLKQETGSVSRARYRQSPPDCETLASRCVSLSFPRKLHVNDSHYNPNAYVDLQLYVPSSRVFCMTESIPFHLCFISSSHSLAAFLPYAPIPSLLSPFRQHTRIQMLRQSSVDVRYAPKIGFRKSQVVN